MYFLIFERSPLIKIHLPYKSLSRTQDSDNGVPGTGISSFFFERPWNLTRVADEEKKGGEEGRERKTNTKVKGRGVFEKGQTDVLRGTKQRIHAVNKLKKKKKEETINETYIIHKLDE